MIISIFKNKTRLLYIILALAFALRLIHVIAIQASPLANHLFVDSDVYDQWAQRILKQGIIGDQPFYQDPLYPYFLAAIYGIFGRNLLAVRLIQILLGTLACYLVYRTSELLFNNRNVSLLASLVAALFIPSVFYEGEVEKTGIGVLLMFLFVWLLLLAYQNKHRITTWLVAGLVLGLAVLVRSNLLVLGIGLCPVLAFRRQFRGLAYFAIGLIAILLPVVVRNSILAREPTFTTTQAGQNFYIGNNPDNKTGQYEAPAWVRPHPQFEETDFAAYANDRMNRRLSPAQVSVFYFKQGFSFVLNNFGSFLVLTAKKIILYLNNYEVPDNQDINFVGSYSAVMKLPVVTFGLLLALAVAGYFSLRRRPVDRLLGLFFLLYALSTVIFFVFSRYRIPSVPLILPYAGYGLWQLITAVRKRTLKSRLGPSLLFIGILVLTFIPIKAKAELKWSRAQCYANLAAQFYNEENETAAIDYYKKALAIAPAHANSLRDLGVLHLNRGDYRLAEEYLKKAVRFNRQHPDAYFFLGHAQEAQNKFAEAIASYQTATRIQPGNLEIWFDLGTARQKSGQYQEAISIYEQMLKIAPENPKIYHNLSVAYFNLKDYRRAKAYLDRVKELGGTVNPAYEKALNKIGIGEQGTENRERGTENRD